jgi:TPP-dependent pyruvate/acetoin dehydrogenase alpha subunit
MDKKTIVSLFTKILFIRIVEEKIADIYSEQEMRCPVHLSIGQEATAVGVCHALEKSDIVLSNHRSHAHYLAKNGNLKKFFAEIYGKKNGCSKGRGGSMHLTDMSNGFMVSTPIVAGTMPLSLGVAFNMKIHKKKNVSVIFLGDGTAEEGIFHECLNFAKLKNLPVLFVCENNLYSVYTHLSERQPNRPLSDIPKAHGLDCYEADGNNVLDVYNVAGEAIRKIKSGAGPAYIELKTYRWREHCGPNYDNNIGYRTEEEFEIWKEKDPIVKLKNKLSSEDILSKNEIKKIELKIQSKIKNAVNYAKRSSLPGKNDLGKYLYN